MLNFFISIIVFAASVFLLGVSIRYGLIGAGRLDDYFTAKSQRTFTGYPWYYRLPFGVGFVPEYFFFLVIGRDNYFKTNWWPIKTSAFFSVLIAMATLNSRSVVYNYFSFGLIRQEGFTALFTSGTFVWFLNIIVVLYLALFVMIVIESIKMHGIYSPVRIFAYSLLSLMMAQLTVIVLGLIVAISLIYIAFKIIVFLFFSSNKRRNGRRDEEEEEESAGSILNGGLQIFKQEVLAWEADVKTERKSRRTSTNSKPKERPKVKIRRKKAPVKKSFVDDEVPRLHPD
jgi:heme A synthase